jgi:hypothetical protein
MPATRRENRVQIQGPLTKYAGGFAAELSRLGFTPASRVNQFYLLAHFSRWLEAESLSVGDLTVSHVDVFLAQRKATHAALFTRRALQPLLGWLAESCVITAEVAAGPLPPEDPAVLVRFERYLRLERRIGARTTKAYVVRVRRFLTGYCPPDELSSLGAAEVTRALLDEGVGALGKLQGCGWRTSIGAAAKSLFAARATNTSASRCRLKLERRLRTTSSTPAAPMRACGRCSAGSVLPTAGCRPRESG